MRLTRYHFATLREDPADAEVASHRLMAKAGFIAKVGAGVYTYSPIFWRTLKKIARIITEEMDRAGGIEMMMPILQPQDLWERSGRLQTYLAGGILWRARDRKDTWFALGPTHEEVVTDFVDRTVNSYKQLPLTLYQQQDKFRDEFRPRYGLMRGREFLMKDAYSFDIDADAQDESYRKMREAYRRIFTRCGLDFIVVQADSGAIGGTGSEEFMVTAESGEDDLLYCKACDYAANVEKAESRIAAADAGEPAPLREEATPNIKTVEQLCGFFPELSAARMVKTVIYHATFPGVGKGDEPFAQPVAALIRGDQDVNEVKLTNAFGALSIELADDETVIKATGAAVGFAGPLGFKADRSAGRAARRPGDATEGYTIPMVADESVRGLTNFLCGVNKSDVHALDVNFGRDLPEPPFADARVARVGEPCPDCGEALTGAKGIEVGHVFKLGTKYSEAMGCTFLNKDGKVKPFVMGCYGIGTSRVAAAAVEQNHDDKGMAWPVQIAPFHVHLLALNIKKADVADAALRCYDALLAAGIEVLFDDRPGVSAGVKFADSDLVGIPYRVNVGRSAAEGRVEIVDRRNGDKVEVAIDDVAAHLAPLALVDGRPDISFVDPDRS